MMDAEHSERKAKPEHPLVFILTKEEKDLSKLRELEKNKIKRPGTNCTLMHPRRWQNFKFMVYHY